jgi:hypothetical protein
MSANRCGTHPNIAARAKQKPVWLSEKPSPQVPQDVWERMRQGFQLQDGLGVNPRIEQQRLWFASNPSFLENAGERGSLYIHYIVERLEERNMPLELALLPVIESAYNPMAYSRPTRWACGSSSRPPGVTSTCARPAFTMAAATSPPRPPPRWIT